MLTGFEHSLDCSSLTEPPEDCDAGDFLLERSDDVIVERVCVTFQRYLYVMSEKRGVYVTFV